MANVISMISFRRERVCVAALVGFVGSVLVASLALTPAASATDTLKLDRSFGNGGIVETAIGNVADPSSLVTLPNGKIVVVGTSTCADLPCISAVRYKTNGKRDKKYAMNGIFSQPLTQFGSQANAAVAQPNGKVVIAGSVIVQDEPLTANFVVVRLTKNGSLDRSFAKKGYKKFSRGDAGDLGAWGISLQTDGKIVVAGTSQFLPEASSHMTAARLKKGGALDTSFGSKGMATANLGPESQAEGQAIAVDPRGRIYVGIDVESPDSRFSGLVLRYRANGTLDTSYAAQGHRSVVVPGNEKTSICTLLMRGKKLIVAGGAGSLSGDPDRYFAGRIREGGSVDTSFGKNGFRVVSLGAYDSAELYGAALTPQGKIMLAGGVRLDGNTPVLGMARLTDNGKLNKKFADNGTRLVARLQTARAIAVQSNGRIVTVGGSQEGFQVARFKV